ncbi:MAG: DUF5615 family PIN-like protein [Sterolibacterium sp.]
MKLLLDQNLSRRLLPKLEVAFPGSSQIQLLGMKSVADIELWSYAKANGYAIVTKDADFVEMSALFGYPPKVVWINLGNVPNTTVMNRLLDHSSTISEFLASAADGVMEIE